MFFSLPSYIEAHFVAKIHQLLTSDLMSIECNCFLLSTASSCHVFLQLDFLASRVMPSFSYFPNKILRTIIRNYLKKYVISSYLIRSSYKILKAISICPSFIVIQQIMNYQMDCFAAYAKSTLRISFFEGIVRSGKTICQICNSSDLLSCPETILNA